MKPRFPILSTIAILASLGSASLGADRPAQAARDPFDRSNVPIEVQPTDPKAAKIVLIAGDSNASHPSGDHEHFAGCALLMRMLQQTPGVAPVMAKDGWPSNPETLKNARTIVFYMDGGGKQTTIAHADEIQKLMDAGVGIVHLHQVIDYPTEPGKQAMTWLGGVYEPKTGARGHWDESFSTFVDHEITRGVTPFKLNDGWILKLRFVPELKGITPLLRTTQLSPKPKPGEKITGSDNIVCWAYERPNGGRSFVLTGAHGHKNWGLEGLRKLAVNGILWSAKVEVPTNGAPVELNPADLMTNLERKPAKAPKKPVAQQQKPDAGALRGIWDIVAFTHDGDADTLDFAVEFDGNHAYRVVDNVRSAPVTFKCDPSQHPAQIDISLGEDTDNGKLLDGIYEMKGDELKVCLKFRLLGDRPRDFKPEGNELLTLKRRRSTN